MLNLNQIFPTPGRRLSSSRLREVVLEAEAGRLPTGTQIIRFGHPHSVRFWSVSVAGQIEVACYQNLDSGG